MGFEGDAGKEAAEGAADLDSGQYVAGSKERLKCQR